MKYAITMSLHHMALVRTAIELWNQKDIRNLILSYKLIQFYPNYIHEWRQAEAQVKVNSSHLELPDVLKKDLLRLIRPIGRQIKMWCLYRRKECQIFLLPHQFIWTPQGTIDQKRTAEMLVNDEDIDVELRYKLACINCLGDKIPELWYRIADHQQFMVNKMHKLVEFWSYNLLGEAFRLERVIIRNIGQSYLSHLYAFRCAVDDGNVAATEFFFNKLSDEERNTLLVAYAERATTKFFYERKPREIYTQVFIYLHSQLSEDQQVQLLKKCTFNVLSCFLDWPYQPLFMISAEPIMHLISEERHFSIMELITLKIDHGWTEFDYRQLFRDYWHLIPLEFKRRSIQNFRMLYGLFECGDEELLKSLFQLWNACERERLLLSEMGRNLCEQLVDNARWRSLNMFIKLCVTTKEAIVQFKEGFSQQKPKRAMYMWFEDNERRWKTFYRFLDDLIAKKSEI